VLWWCEVKTAFTITYNFQSTFTASRVCNTVIRKNMDSWCTLSTTEVLQLDKDINWRCKVLVEITIEENGEKFNVKQPIFDFLSPFDGILVIGDEKIHVNKKFLASQSEYFFALFNRDFKESKQEEIEIEDVDPQDLRTALSNLYGLKDLPITDDNVENILVVAHRFDLKFVVTVSELV
ncbi:hypothetical protein PFISCL1PPCAC_12286, partial [Pristionchus fissidentatus]